LYDVRAIDAQINRQSRRLLIWGVTAVLLSIAAYLSYFRIGLPWLLVALGAYLACWRLVTCLLNVAKLLWLRKLALTASGREADPKRSEDQPVNWWELLRAGFDPTTPTGAFESPDLRLAGRPWRVLVRGSTQIPVFKKRHCTGPNGQRIRDQHYARIAGYCRLIEEAVGAQSPYGIVLFDDCYEGIAINASKVGATELLIESLVDARTVIQNSHGNIAPDPAPPTTCANCPVGRPRVHRPGQTETLRCGVPLPVFAARGADRRRYHSACGDRFSWLPPHQRVKEKGLQSIGREASSAV
jgi:hypothetical protein